MFRVAETLTTCENCIVHTYSTTRHMRSPLVWGRVKDRSPRSSCRVQSAPCLPSPAGERRRTEWMERRDCPADFSQPYQGQGNHVIMCEWIRRGGPGISALPATFTLRFQPALIFLCWAFTSRFSHDTQNPHLTNLLRVEVPSELDSVPGIAASLKYPC